MATDSVETLLWEYREMRQEIRDIFTSQESTLRTGLLFVAALSGAALTQQFYELVFIIPSTIFTFAMIILFKATVMNLIGAYCQVLAHKIKETLAEQVVMDWEGGKIWERTTKPFGIVQVGIYFGSIPFVLAFSVAAWYASKEPRLGCYFTMLHVIELVTMLCYGWACMRVNQTRYREQQIKNYGA